MRGFGHVKEKNVKAAKEREATLLAAYRSPATAVGRRRIGTGERAGRPRSRMGLGEEAQASRERAAREGRVCGEHNSRYRP